MDEMRVATDATKVLEQVRRVVVGKDRVLLWVMAAMLAKGHILLQNRTTTANMAPNLITTSNISKNPSPVP